MIENTKANLSNRVLPVDRGPILANGFRVVPRSADTCTMEIPQYRLRADVAGFGGGAVAGDSRLLTETQEKARFRHRPLAGRDAVQDAQCGQGGGCFRPDGLRLGSGNIPIAGNGNRKERRA